MEFVIISVGCFALLFGGSHVVQADLSLAVQPQRTVPRAHLSSMSATQAVHALTAPHVISVCLIEIPMHVTQAHYKLCHTLILFLDLYFLSDVLCIFNIELKQFFLKTAYIHKQIKISMIINRKNTVYLNYFT